MLSWSISSAIMRDRFLSAIQQATSTERKEEIESSFNFLEIGDIFQASGCDTSDAEDEYLAELIAEAWRNLLARRYPDREFVVEVVPAEVTGGTVGVHFFESRSNIE